MTSSLCLPQVLFIHFPSSTHRMTCPIPLIQSRIQLKPKAQAVLVFNQSVIQPLNSLNQLLFPLPQIENQPTSRVPFPVVCCICVVVPVPPATPTNALIPRFRVSFIAELECSVSLTRWPHSQQADGDGQLNQVPAVRGVVAGTEIVRLVVLGRRVGPELEYDLGRMERDVGVLDLSRWFGWRNGHGTRLGLCSWVFRQRQCRVTQRFASGVARCGKLIAQ